MTFEQFLADLLFPDNASTEDVLASFLPLLREVIEAHRQGLVAPLEGTQELHVEGVRLWFEEAKRQSPRANLAEVSRLEQSAQAAIEVVNETRRTTEVEDGSEQLIRTEIGTRGTPITRPVYLPGYVTWEHELGHHDPLTDAHSLGLILASLACGLNLNEPAAVETFVAGRRNLFALNSRLHPVLAQAILRLTELDRRRRPQDLSGLLRTLENYREQPVDFDLDLARVPGFQTRERTTRHEVVLSKLKERLFDISRRNSLLHFRPTLQSVNLTHSSIPLTLDIRNIREDQILVWSDRLQQQLVDGKPISLNKHLNFAEALYLPSILDRIIADSRRDHQEFGFAQLRLVVCFLSWTNLKETPVERFVSPLVLIPVKLTKTKGIRDTFSLEALSSEAEINPVVRHQFQQLYNIDLPETIDLAETSLDSLFEYLTGKIQSSEPAVTLNKIDRPRIDLVHDKAKRRLDQYRRSARVAGRGVRTFLDLDYSYDLANYHPLGIKLFSALIRTPGSHLRDIVESKPRPKSYAAPDSNEAVVERSFYQVRDATEENPYLWNFDLCSLTLANLRYRRMSLVRDYEAILNQQLANPAFETTFSLAPRPIGRELPPVPSLDERFDVVPCDPTQATAIAEARRGESYIIQGPPGTGKSQTITNLIADFVARGKRVLFVCEKRAAIDVVFARLKQCGLGPLCSLIHDSQTDKKEFILDLKQTYELFTSDSPAPESASSRAAILRKLQSNLGPLAKFEEAMEGESPLTGLPLRRFLDRCVRLASLRPELSPEVTERLPTYGTWWSHREQLASVDVSLRDLEPTGILSHHPLRRIRPDLATHERPVETVRSTIQPAGAQLQRLMKALAQCGIPTDQWNSLRRATDLVDYVRQLQPLARHGNLALADPAAARAREFEQATEQLTQLAEKLSQAQQATTKWRQKLPPDDTQTALEQARSWQGKFWAWLSPAWWQLRKVLHRSYDFSSHTVRPTWTQVLQALAAEHTAQTELNQLASTVRTTFGGEHDHASLQQELTRLRELVATLPDWLRRIHAALLKSTKAESIVERTLAAAEPLAACGELDTVMADYRDMPLEELRSELASISRSIQQVPLALSVLKELDGVPAEIGRTLRELPWELLQAESAIAYRTWEQLTRDDRDLGRFDGRVRQRHIRRLETLYDDCLAANAEEVCRRVRDRFREHLQTTNLPASKLTPDQKEFKKNYLQGRRTLEHEFGKTMRYKAIRELVDGEAGQVISDLKPVWLMSPLSVSDTLPLATDFVDVVIFDEASQVPLEEAVPSLFRGKQVIVVGDEMQLPPTDFFSSKRTETDGEDLQVVEGEERVQYELTCDSFLSHAAKNLPATMLGWHYRSRSESLISFSNWAFYDGRLLTVPEHGRLSGIDATVSNAPISAGIASPTDLLLSRPVSFHLLPGGTYDKRRNRAEADHIARLVADLLKRREGQSIGVIAFSEAQQEEIETALNRLASDDEEFRRLLDEEWQREVDGQFVGLLVKNLENIQGDERDIIILSICYGRGPNGKMLMNFGPINKSGGEKRLNVAFSRAKQHMAIVSTIRYSEITNEYNEGANCLRSYLRYAEAMSSGDAATAQRVLSGVTRWKDSIAHSNADSEDSVVEQLADCLRDRGYVVDLGVGQSHFRVDLAVRLPGESGYRLGILVDTPIQYEQAEPLERDMMRPRLLRTFGWRVESVLAKDWYENRKQELARLLAALKVDSPEVADDDAGSESEDSDSDNADSPGYAVLPEETITGTPNPVEADDYMRGGPSDSAFEGIPSATCANLASGSLTNTRRFEFRSGQSSKFWEIAVAGEQHTVRFGRIGTMGQNQTKTFPSASAAQRDAARLIAEKQRKGYRESSS